jgi:adenosine kinase
VHNDIIKGAHFANTLGALRTQGRDFEVFKSLAETEAIIQKNYHLKT